MLENFIIGIISGVVGSGIFLALIYRLRPRIEISPYISRDTKPDGTSEYGFKFINRTPYPILEIKARVRLRTAETAPKGIIWDSRMIFESYIWHIQKFDAKDKDFNFAQRTCRTIALETIWNDTIPCELMFEVMARHSFSGITTVTSRKYYKKRDSIRDGVHHVGDSLDVS